MDKVNVSPDAPDHINKIAVRAGTAAALLDLSRSHIYVLMASGELPSFTIGRSRRVRVADLLAYVERQAA